MSAGDCKRVFLPAISQGPDLILPVRAQAPVA